MAWPRQETTMRYLSAKVLPVVAALLLWAVATPADAGANAWILWHQYTYTDLDRMNDRFANSASGWRLTEAFESMAACKSSEVSFAGFMADGLNYGGNWSAKAYGSLVEARWIVTGVLERPNKHMTVEYLCFPDTIDPRLAAAPTPKPPKVATAPKDDNLGFVPDPLGIIHYTPGRPIVVTVKLNGRSSARLVLDTGADFSVVKSELLAAAGVDLARPAARGKVIGVAGETGASYFHVIFETVGHRVQMPHVAALNTYDDFADGLLGRDFLDRFKVVMDPAAGTITLVPR
jgi:aspartyl protease